MNQRRRKKLEEIKKGISELKDKLEEIHEQEEVYKDNMPENPWESERYERAEEVVGQLEESDDYLQQVMDLIEEMVS